MFGGWGQGVGEVCMVFTEGLEAATGGTLAMTAATVRRARCWSASGLAPFALLRFTYREGYSVGGGAGRRGSGVAVREIVG